MTNLEVKQSFFSCSLCCNRNSDCQRQSQKLMSKPSVIQIAFRFATILIMLGVFVFSFWNKSYVFSSPWLFSDASKYLVVFLYLGIEAGML